jgi:hypothetical protein
MNGQWSGRFQGTNEGGVNLNIDDKRSSYSGVAYFFDDNPQMPAVAVHFEIVKSELVSGSGVSKSSWINPLEPGSFTEVSWDSVKGFYPNASFPKTIEIKFEYSNCSLNVSAKTDINTEVIGVLNRSELSQPSSLLATKMTWSEYKSFVLSNEDECVYRGQSEPWKLQTSFHRRGRYDLTRYQQEDIPQLHRALSVRTRHVFNLSNAQENGAFLNLVQHHGYPTPLLDWTHSPYVAAFFAFRNITKKQGELDGEKIARIYVFNADKWRKRFIQNQNMLTGQLHLSVIDLLAIENSRMVPQQATTTITNVADIESFIESFEQKSGEQFLQVIDIPWSERIHVVRELKLMGLTAGSLFPGLDGTCEELKDKMFD